MFEIVELNKIDDLVELQDGWKDLLSRSSDCTIFQTWEWIYSFCEIYSNKKILFLLFRHQSKLVAIAPLEIVTLYPVGLRFLQLVGVDGSDYLNLIIDKDYEKSVLGQITVWLNENSTRWDVVRFNHVREDFALLKVLNKRKEVGKNYVVGLAIEEKCPYIKLDQSFSISSKIKKRENALVKKFGYEYSLVENVNIENALLRFFDLHRKRWRKRLMPGVLMGERKYNFHKLLAQRMSSGGMYHLHGVKIDNEYQAMLESFSYENNYYYYLSGYNPDFSKYSIGTLILARSIKDAISRGCIEYDFLRGDEKYKRRWTNVYRNNYCILLRKADVRGLSAYLLLFVKMNAEIVGKKIMKTVFGY